MRRTGPRFLSIVVVLCLLVFAAGVSGAGAQELDKAFRDDIVKLMEVTGSAKLGQQVVSLVSRQVLDGFKSAHPDVPARAFDIGQELLEAEFGKSFEGPDGLLAKMIPIYARHFSHQEVRGLLAFYDSDLGRKTIAVMPNLIQEGAQLGQEWAAEMVPRLERLMQERLRAEGFVK